jgi:hypothetical protein
VYDAIYNTGQYQPGCNSNSCINNIDLHLGSPHAESVSKEFILMMFLSRIFIPDLHTLYRVADTGIAGRTVAD